jgi:N-methylhydantoinase A
VSGATVSGDEAREAPGGLRRVGVDTGGTFTDCVLIDYDANELAVAKVASRPDAPQVPTIEGIERLLRNAGARRESAGIESVTHGTTIATNAVITGQVATVGFITTRGFRDVLEIGTQMRPKLYDLHQPAKPTIVPRELRVEVGGRIAADGTEVEPLDEEEVRAAVERLVDHGVESIAIGCLFSFANPAHELEIQDVVRSMAPHMYVGSSAMVAREPREYPRFAAAAINASLAPKIDPYVRSLEDELADHRFDTRLYIMQGNGGIATTARAVGENVHQLILSGPAAGVTGGAREAAASGFGDCVTFDVGGTSADIAMVIDGQPRTSIEIVLPNGVPCSFPHIEVETIGAGGGSIAVIDAGGALSVGPASAGADPGPACYGRGGHAPTVTDAHLLLGHFSPAGLLDGELSLDRDLAERAIRPIADRLGTDLEDAALGVLAVLEENMAGGIRRAAARHGDDLRDFVLLAGGGAGPLHAESVARALRMPAAVIPSSPGLLSALGLLAAHIRYDLVAPIVGLVKDISLDRVQETFAGLSGEAVQILTDDGVSRDAQRFERSLDLRYFGQEYALRVPIDPTTTLEEAVQRFHAQHSRTFGHQDTTVETELVAARLIATGLRDIPDLRPALPDVDASPIEHRDVRFLAGGQHYVTPVYERGRLGVGQVISGPAIVSQLDATTLVPPGSSAEVDPAGNLILTSMAPS